MTHCRRPRLTNTDDIELETTLEELALDLGGDAVETDVALGVDGGSGHGRHCSGWNAVDNWLEEVLDYSKKQLDDAITREFQRVTSRRGDGELNWVELGWFKREVQSAEVSKSKVRGISHLPAWLQPTAFLSAKQ